MTDRGRGKRLAPAVITAEPAAECELTAAPLRT
jgi:hypothetical protein